MPAALHYSAVGLIISKKYFRQLADAYHLFLDNSVVFGTLIRTRKSLHKRSEKIPKPRIVRRVCVPSGPYAMRKQHQVVSVSRTIFTVSHTLFWYDWLSIL